MFYYSSKYHYTILSSKRKQNNPIALTGYFIGDTLNLFFERVEIYLSARSAIFAEYEEKGSFFKYKDNRTSG